jgi:hypothetical protein
MGAVTAAAADDECLGPDLTVRVGRLLADGSLGWPWMRSPACSAHKQPPLMHGRAIVEMALGARSAVVFRPFLDGAGVEPATDDLSGRCSTRLSYPVVVIQESNPAPCGATVDDRLSAVFSDAACATPTDGSGCRTPVGRACTRTPTCERSPPSADSLAPEPFSSGATPSADVRPATRARRRGCAGLRAESPRSGSARTAGTPAACPLPPACDRPCGHCTHRRR